MDHVTEYMCNKNHQFHRWSLGNTHIHINLGIYILRFEISHMNVDSQEYRFLGMIDS